MSNETRTIKIEVTVQVGSNQRVFTLGPVDVKEFDDFIAYTLIEDAVAEAEDMA